jgi:AraC family transcriptional regulator, ethanolamine operon transcriptional activator
MICDVTRYPLSEASELTMALSGVDKMAGVISCEFHDIDHFREHLVGWDTPAIQIEPGRLRINLHSINLGGLIFSDIRVNRKVLDHSRVEAGWLSFVIGLSPSIFCGTEISAGQLTVLTPGREYRSIIAKGWHSIEIVIKASDLADEGLRLSAQLEHVPENATISLPIELVGLFRRLARAAFGRPADGPIDQVQLRCALLRALGKALVRSGESVPERRHRAEGYELMQKMIRYIESRLGQRVTVSEIASELDVTPRALNYAARSTLDISPFDLVLAYRLNLVRGELWDARLLNMRVTTAALAQDFGHLGRFSRQYQTLFGELPSETLHRIKLLGSE